MTLAEQEILESQALSGRHMIVLVDDDPDVLAALERALDGEPYDILATTRPDTALEWLSRGGVSLVVVGHRVAGIGGMGLPERVRRIAPGTLRVLLTSYPDHSLADGALRRTVRGLLLPERRIAGLDWPRLEGALRRAAWVFVQGTRWLVGFLWMADAGGRGMP